MPLAIGSYSTLTSLADEPDMLNLAWTLDERELLSTDVLALVTEELSAEIAEELPWITSYLVTDPYGEAALGPSVAKFFSQPDWSVSVTCGAGVGPLLHGLSSLAGNQPVHLVTDVYPDLPFWVEQSGNQCVSLGTAEPAGDPTAAHARAAAERGAQLLVLERPSLSGDHFADPAELLALCEAVAPSGATVLVDESNANYYPPRFSGANVVERANNLVVVRGVSKAYGLGGVRLGYCVAAPVLTRRIRRAVPPLEPSSLSLRIGQRVLGVGDATDRLRQVIAVHRAEVLSRFAAAGLNSAVAASAHLPYVLLPRRSAEALKVLAGLGIRGKLHPIWSAAHLRLHNVGRVSVPLTAVRMDDLRRRTSGG